MKEFLLLKWGTVKHWNLKSDASLATMKKYCDLGCSASVATQKDTPEQRRLLCELIDGLDGNIQNDWDGEYLTKEQAKDYITNYRGQ